MQKKIATGKIYLGGSFNREIDHERVERAKEILAKNPTIAKVHFPFDYDFVDPEEKNPEIGGQRSMTWRVGTFQNDLNGINSATCGVFLYDMDILDDGCAFEIGFMRANHEFNFYLIQKSIPIGMLLTFSNKCHNLSQEYKASN